MGGGGGSGSLFRTYKGGTYSQGGFSKKTFYSKESQKPNDSAEEILNRHIQSIRSKNSLVLTFLEFSPFSDLLFVK